MENEHGRTDLLTQKQIDWCDEHCDFEWFVKDDGKVYSKNDDVQFKNGDSIDSFLVEFGNCENFYSIDCKSLKSLKGTPKKISGSFFCDNCDSLELFDVVFESVGDFFSCYNCDSLKSLEGAPKKIGGTFDCIDCDSLKSLKGASKKVGGDFYCSDCDSLESLEGAPETVGEGFYCSSCKLLKSLEGVPKRVGEDLDCSFSKLFKSIDELKNTKIKGMINYEGCPKLKKYDLILDDMNVFRMWQRSTCSADEFLKEYSGFIDAQKYGI